MDIESSRRDCTRVVEDCEEDLCSDKKCCQDEATKRLRAENEAYGLGKLINARKS